MRLSLRSVIGATIAAVIIYFMARSLGQNLKRVGSYSIEVSSVGIVASVVSVAVLFSIYGFLWKCIIGRFGYEMTFGQSMRMWFLSQAAKYIPGKVWFALGRIYLCESAGIPKTVGLFATGLEVVLSLASAMIVFGLASISGPNVFPSSHILGFLVIPLAFAISHPGFIKRTLRGFGKVSIDLSLTYRDTLWLILAYSGCWFIYGFGFFQLATSLHIKGIPLEIVVNGTGHAYVSMTGINAIAWALGFLSLVTPAGLGVREGASGVLLSTLVNQPYPLLIPLAARIWITVCEAATIGLARAWRGKG